MKKIILWNVNAIKELNNDVLSFKMEIFFNLNYFILH